MCSAAIEWSTLSTSVRFIWSKACSSLLFALLIFCLHVPSVAESEVVKSPTITVLLFYFSFLCINVCLIYLGALMLNAYIFITVICSQLIDPFITI